MERHCLKTTDPSSHVLRWFKWLAYLNMIKRIWSLWELKKKKITRASDQNPGILSPFPCRNALESTDWLGLNRDTSLPPGSRHGHAHGCTVFRGFKTKETTTFLVLLQSLHHRFHFIIFKKVAKLSTFWAMFFKVRHLLFSRACWVEISITYRSLQSQGLWLRLIYNNTRHDLGVLHALC